MPYKEKDFNGLKLIIKEMQCTLDELSGILGPNLTGEIGPIISENLARGRFHRFLNNNHVGSMHDYVHLVVENYRENRAYLKEVQENRNEDVWISLYSKLQNWAYKFLIRNGFAPDRHTFEKAIAYADLTSAAILTSWFPYDTNFDPWVFVILSHICCNQMRQATRQKKTPEYRKVALDDSRADLPDCTELEKMVTDHIDLVNALEDLSPCRKKVIILRYFKGLSYEEIAQVLGKSKRSVYKAHFDAIQSISNIMG